MTPPSPRPGSSARVSPNHRQIATANQTLNTIFGRPTKSWMHDSPCNENAQSPGRGVVSSSVRPRRPVQPPATNQGNNSTGHSQVPQNPANDGSVLPSPALTNEPSPAASTSRVSPNTSPTEAQSTNPEKSTYNNVHFTPASELYRDVTRVSALLISEQPDTRVRPSSNSGASNSIMTPVEVGADQHLQDHQMGTAAGVQNNNSTSQGKRGRELEGLDPSALHSSPKRMRLAGVPRDAGTSLAAESELTAQMDHYAGAVQQRILSLGGLSKLGNEVERPRYKFLQEACLRHDQFYAVLHQLFCLWSFQDPFRYQILEPMDQKSVDKAFNFLSQFLRPNSTMQPGHLAWFAAFPLSLHGDLPPLHRTCIQRVTVFLTALAGTWMSLLTFVRQRLYPVTAHEMIHVLGCPSQVLRGIMYTVSRRSLGIPDNAASDLNSIFLRDESIELNAIAGQTEGKNMDSSREELAVRYRSLVAEARRTVAQLGLNRDSPSRAGFPASVQDGTSQVQTATASQPPELPQPPSAPVPSPHYNAHSFMLRPSSTGPVHPGPRLPMPQTQGGTIQPPGLPNQQPIQYQAGRGSVPASQSSPRTNTTGVFQQAPILLSQGLPAFYSHHYNHLIQRQGSHGGHPDANHGAQLGVQAQPGPAHMSHFSPHVHYAAGHIAGHPTPPRSMGQGLQLNSPQAYFPQTIQQNLNVHSSVTSHRTAALPHPHTHTGTRPTRHPVGYGHPARTIPDNEFPLSPYDWTSVEMAAHQTQLRSPMRKPAKRGSGRHFQYVDRYVVEPTRVDPGNGIRTLEFTLSAEELSRTPTKGSVPMNIPVRYYFESCSRYRLRCCALSKQETTVKDGDWAISDTAWPDEIYTFFNGRALGVPRKQHFSRDQPLELTDFLVEGKNVVQVSVPGNRCNVGKNSTFYLAIEAVITSSYGVLKNLVETAPHTTSEATKAEIARRLKPAESDDVIVEDNNLYISLADPFSSVMFVTPVRGIYCKHLECFDLEIWLDTRPRRSKGVELSMSDCWKCPICSNDARPNRLRIDDFFLGVRASLTGAGKESTKKIQATADGNWITVVEPDETDDEGPSHTALQQPPQEASRASSASAPHAVIEISDD